jgi:hypothetical protein
MISIMNEECMKAKNPVKNLVKFTKKGKQIPAIIRDIGQYFSSLNESLNTSLAYNRADCERRSS